MTTNDLKQPNKRFMLVSIDVVPQGLNFACWMSSYNMFTWEGKVYPYVYKYNGIGVDWLIRSNIEMTSKMVVMCGEQGDRICTEQITRNNRRKIANL